MTINAAMTTSVTGKYPERDLTRLIASYRPRLLRLGVAVSYIGIAALLYLGWRSRAYQPFHADSGIGYGLGIVGGSMMLLLLLYPLRKQLRVMRNMGPMSWWFRLHMTFGVLGPVCILFHCGFRFGSLNSNIALLCMLIVAGSGLFGRYFYMKIHHGLYGQRATLNSLRADTERLNTALAERLPFAPQILARIEPFEQLALTETRSLPQSALLTLRLGLGTRLLHWRLRRQLHTALQDVANRAGWSRSEAHRHWHELSTHLSAHIGSIRKTAELAFYERLFSLWHILHLPLFFMLLISGIVHVVAVHIY